jgi:molybdopterin synthase sulfur carrier subunit
VTQVRIPPVLRASAEGNKQVDLVGATVGDVLEQLVQRFPGLRDQLFSAEGDLNRFVNVYLNSEDVRYLSELETPAGTGDTIVVLPAMAGGTTTTRHFRPDTSSFASSFARCERLRRDSPSLRGRGT